MLIIVLLMGLCFGSFITLASYRLPRDEDILVKPSRCTACHKPLAVRDLFPVLSWLLNRRTCRFCGVRIHWRYPAIELLTAATFGLIYWRYGLTQEGCLLALLAVMLLTMIVADFEHYIIPDEVHYVLLPAGLVWRWQAGAEWGDMLGGLLAGAAIGLLLCHGYKYMRKKDGLGLGDVKFLAVAGLWLGIQSLVPFLFLSGVFGVFTALLWSALKRGKRFPFGPALALALFLCVVFPEVPNAFWAMQLLVYR